MAETIYYEHGFDREGFENYIHPINHFTTDSLLNTVLGGVIKYGLENMNNSKDSFAYFLSDITGLCFGECAMFFTDSMLTAHGKAEKEKWLKKLANRDYL